MTGRHLRGSNEIAEENFFSREAFLAEEVAVDTRVLESPVARSLGFHLLLLLVAFFCATQGPKFDTLSEPIEVTVNEILKDGKTKASIVKRSAGQEVKEARKDSFLSDKTREVKEQQSSRNEGELSGGSGQAIPIPAKRSKLTLSDFGVKIPAARETDYHDQRNWANSQLGEEMKGGQYIQGMKEGEFSALNTKEFVFYSYFERVRRQLDQAWQPILRENVQRLLKAGRHLASNSDYVTRALVTMNSRGEIIRIRVLEESGTQDLDQAAVDALNKAGPYPNPPRGLIDSSGQVEIRWDFILKT
jgi:TonB family protein